MANNIPITGATPAAGGYLIPVEYAETMVQTVLRENAIAQLARRVVLRGRQLVFTTYLGRPIVGFVGEGALKPITGAAWGQVTVGIQEIATVIPVTNQLLEDAREDPMLLVEEDTNLAVADVIDAHALGLQNGVGIASQFGSSLAATTQTVEYSQARPDALAFAISQAMGKVEANGGRPNGAVLSWSFRQQIREARQTASGLGAAQPVYGQLGTLDPFQGLNAAFSTNLADVGSAPAAGKVIGIVGDFANAIMLMRNDITVAQTSEATLNNAGSLIHLWQQNMQAWRYDIRVGFYANDLNRQFCAIIDTA
jgi:HK97 family phage major capsid protein